MGSHQVQALRPCLDGDVGRVSPHIQLGTPGARINYLARQCPGDYDPNMPSVSVLNVLINVVAGNKAKRLVKAEGTSFIYPGKQ
jgi:hypothetical protein